MPESLSSPNAAVAIAPLPNPRLARKFQPIRGSSSAMRVRSISATSLVPLFLAAVLFLSGITLARCVYLPPGPLMLCFFAFAALTGAAAFKAPRIVWLPMLLLWIGLGAWSAEMEPPPVLNAKLAESVSDGLLRTLEGTVVTAEPIQSGIAEDQNPGQDLDGSIRDQSTSAGPDSGHDSSRSRLRQQVDLEVHAAEVLTDDYDGMEPVPNGGVSRVRLQLDWPAETKARGIDCGETIRVTARLVSPQIFLDPGVWNRAAYLETRQVAATAAVDATRMDEGVPRLALLGAEPRSPGCMLDRARKRINENLESLPAMSSGLPAWLRAWLPAWLSVSPADAAMLTALLTGNRSALTRGIRSGFERTGSFHLVVVSGLHLAIVAGCVLAIARRLRMGSVASTLLTIVLAFAYAVFTGFGVPVQRSFWMVTLYLLGRLLYRDRSPLNVIGFAALCLAAASPHSIFDASFQMTLLAVTAIAGIATPLLEPGVQTRLRALRNLKLVSMDAKLPKRIAAFRVLVRMIAEEVETAWDASQTGWQGRWLGWRLLPGTLTFGLRAAELICVTAIVELALALPMAIYFHRVTVYALPVNLCLLPLLGLMLPVAMILLVVIAVWPAAALVPAAACVALLHAGIFVVSRLGHWASADLRLPEPAAARTLLALALFVLAVWLVRLADDARWTYLRWAGIAALAGMAALAVAPRPVEHPRDALLFEAIDVGQGDSLLLITPDGHTLLVDGGGLGLPFQSRARQADSAFDTGEDIVSPTLWARGIRRLDAVALSHAHHDHMGGLPAILRNFRPKELWVGRNPPVGAYKDLLHVADAAGVAVHSLSAGEDFSFGDARVRVVGPAAGYRPGAEPSNEDSLVLRMSYGDEAVLLEGDAEKAEELTMLAGFDLGSMVLKVGHHGSRSSTQPAFLAAVHPQWAVISCGRKNRFGHPRQEILEELQQAHVRTYRTDSDGAMCFLLRQKWVEPEPGCGR